MDHFFDDIADAATANNNGGGGGGVGGSSSIGKRKSVDFSEHGGQFVGPIPSFGVFGSLSSASGDQIESQTPGGTLAGKAPPNLSPKKHNAPDGINNTTVLTPRNRLSSSMLPQRSPIVASTTIQMPDHEDDDDEDMVVSSAAPDPTAATITNELSHPSRSRCAEENAVYI